MAKLLLFNIQNPETRSHLQVLSLRLNFTMSDVAPEKQCCRIRDLLSGLTGDNPDSAPSFQDEMLVMNGFDRGDLNFFLNELRRAGHVIRLKAVVTETNAGWTSSQLHAALRLEHEALRGRK